MNYPLGVNMRRYITLLMLCGVTLSCVAKASADEGKVPVIYCSDLFHPHDDPDDHFDIASLYAIPEIDIKAIILDQGSKQEQQPGSIPVGQLNHLTGRNVPRAIGLSQKLRHSADTGLDEPQRYQGGVRLILTVLEKSPVPVTIITVGSLRDVAAAHNRSPELFRKKVSRIFSFIGDAKGAFQEYNVSLDPHAYQSVMNAGLPLYWVPCFDGGLWKNEDGNASFWQADHAELLRDASEPVLNFFIYALLHKKDRDSVGLLYQNVSEKEKHTILSGQRNLWCAAVFPYVANQKFVFRAGHYLSVPPSEVRSSDRVTEVFTFSPVKVHVDGEGKESYKDVTSLHTVNRFHFSDKELYTQAMTSVTRELIKELSRQTSPKQTETRRANTGQAAEPPPRVRLVPGDRAAKPGLAIEPQ